MSSWTGHQPITLPTKSDTNWLSLLTGNKKDPVQLTPMLLEFKCLLEGKWQSNQVTFRLFVLTSLAFVATNSFQSYENLKLYLEHLIWNQQYQTVSANNTEMWIPFRWDIGVGKGYNQQVTSSLIIYFHKFESLLVGRSLTHHLNSTGVEQFQCSTIIE